MVADEAMLWNATMISINEVACSLPPSPVSLAAPVAGVVPRPVHGLRVAVSNDGEIFSLEQLIVVYDSTCLQCNNTGSCRRKVGLSLATTSLTINKINKCKLNKK